MDISTTFKLLKQLKMKYYDKAGLDTSRGSGIF